MDTEGVFSYILIAVGVVVFVVGIILDRRDKKRFEKRLSRKDKSETHSAKEDV